MLFVLLIDKEIFPSIAVDTKINDKHTVIIRFTTINKSHIISTDSYVSLSCILRPFMGKRIWLHGNNFKNRFFLNQN